MKLTCIYRISDGSYKKDRLPNATKDYCLETFLEVFAIHSKTIIMADNVEDETFEWLNSFHHYPMDVFDEETGHETTLIPDINVVRTNSNGNGFAANIALDMAMKVETDYVYFVEDDYLHLSDSYEVLMQGLEISDYVSLYDHPDKYLPGSQGGNPFIDEDGGEVTKVFLTEDTHWKLTNSTTMTFATSVDVLKKDRKVWKQFTNHKHPNDFQCFLRLREMGRSLITPIPARSTHCDIPWVAPLVRWENV